MSLITQEIKNLVAGVSQQPAILRHPEQLEQQLNGFSSEAAGLQKRPPSIHIANLGLTIADTDKPLVHFINRDASEKYVVILTSNDLVVYDLAGNKKTVKFEGNAKKYLTNTQPRQALRCLTIADYTFIVNRNKVVAMSESKTADVWKTQGALVNIKSGQYGRTYRIDINGSTVASHTTPDGSDKSHTSQIATDYIANQLAEKAREAGYTVATGSSWLYLTKLDGSGKTTITSVNVYDGYNNQAAFGFFHTTQKFSNLPSSAPEGFIVKVAGEEGSSTDDYYVRYDTDEGVWIECAKPDILNGFDAATMPHVLVREADGTFTFKEAEWDEREIGDDDSNPVPSFIDYNINDIFFYRNRLGVIAGENVILTRSAEFFNFWMTSALEVQDTDPIDLAVSDNRIATLVYAVPYDEDCVLFSREAQFMLQANGVLTPKDAVVSSPVTHFGSSEKAKPTCAGRYLYFPAERSQYTTVREFFTAADNTDRKDAQDITSHIPNYIPNGVYKLIPSTTENVLMFLTEGAENKMYLYKYLFVDSIRQQAAWSEWDFSDRIIGADFIDSYLYLLIDRNGELCIERISFTYNTNDFDTEPYRVFLDRKVIYTIPSGAYNEITGTTSITLSNVYDDITETTFTKSNEQGYSLVDEEGGYVKANGNTITLEGNQENKKVTIGRNYLFKITLSPLMIKTTGQDGGTRSITDGRLNLKYFWVNYNETGYFKITVNHHDKNTYVYENTSRILDLANNKLNTLPFNTDKFKVPVQSLNTNCTITVESDAPNPVALIGAGWIGDYYRSTKQY